MQAVKWKHQLGTSVRLCFMVNRGLTPQQPGLSGLLRSSSSQVATVLKILCRWEESEKNPWTVALSIVLIFSGSALLSGCNHRSGHSLQADLFVPNVVFILIIYLICTFVTLCCVSPVILLLQTARWVVGCCNSQKCSRALSNFSLHVVQR